MANVTLFSARACPYAHRSRLVLSHKQVEHELVEIDLQNKPAWFDRNVSGYGKVPALQHGDLRIWESAVINEYVDEAFPGPALLPEQAGPRAQARIWIDFANSRFTPAFGKLLRSGVPSDQAAARKELLEGVALIEKAGFEPLGDGPFLLGSATPTLVDFAFYPWFERWPALERLRGLALPAEHARLQRWLRAVSELPAVRTHANPSEYYVERYAKHAAPAATQQAV